MNKDLEQAKLLLQQQACTCILCKEGIVYKSHSRGVRPLVEFLDSGTDLRGFSCADKVVGRAAAFVYCLLGIAAVHAQVMSRDAQTILTGCSIACTCDRLVDSIRNRQGTGPCPMETATRLATTPSQALEAIRQTLEKLSS